MKKIVHVNVEHDGQSSFGTAISALSENDALDNALEVIRWEIRTAPGKVTRVEFTYEGEENEE